MDIKLIKKEKDKQVVSRVIEKFSKVVEGQNVEQFVKRFKGEKGDRGPQGEQGIQGERGLQGDPGISGQDGLTGKDGYTPVKGVDYFDGLGGSRGDKGDKGDPGEVEPLKVIELIKKDKLLDISDIRNGLGKRGSGYKLEDQRWHGAGLNQPAGLDTQFQYNNEGVMAAANVTYDELSGNVSVNGDLNEITGLTVVSGGNINLSNGSVIIWGGGTILNAPSSGDQLSLPVGPGTLALESGASDTFTSLDGKTVTVVNGIITSIV